MTAPRGMKRLEGARPGFSCGSCRRFDGLTWCKQWNQPTTSEAPICGAYLGRKRGSVRDSIEIFPTNDGEVTAP